MSSVEAALSGGADVESSVEMSSPVFFPVSLTKLLVLSLCTLGLYQIYWFYKNWQLVKHRERSDIIPPMRSLFGVFFCYALFHRVEEEAVGINVTPVSAGPMAAGWIVLTVLWRLPQPYWLICIFAVAFMLPVQAAINRINKQVTPNHDPNKRFGAWNIITVVFGGLFLALAIVGSFLPQDQV